MSSSAILWFDKIGIADVPAVGGKTASLGEMMKRACRSWRAHSGRVRNNRHRLSGVRRKQRKVANCGVGEMKTLGSPFFRVASRGLCIMAASLAFVDPAGAGVVDGVKTVDGLTVYLGVVPAAVTRAHAPQHTERTMHGGISKPSIHDVHLLVAVFNSANGQRLRNVTVTARIYGTNRNRWTVPLTPMTINGAYTYGGYTSLGLEEDIMISIDIRRLGRTPHTSTTTAQFEYVHD